jgi:hypothetical protein
VDFSLSAQQRKLTEAAGGFAGRELNQDLAKREYNWRGTRMWPQPALAGRTAVARRAAAAPVARTTSGSISVARPSRVTLIDLLRAFAAQECRRCRFVHVPWPLICWPLRSGEFVRVPLPCRADSLPGSIYTALGLAGGDQLARLGVNLRAFTVSGSAVPSGAP